MISWQLGFAGMCVVALCCLGYGVFLGYGMGRDDAEDDPGRHRMAPDDPGLEVKVKHVAPSTAELFRHLEDSAVPPTEPLQAPLGALVRPRYGQERATDVIAAITADTDRFIASLGGDQ